MEVVRSLVLILMKQAKINMEMENPGAMRIYYSMCTIFTQFGQHFVVVACNVSAYIQWMIHTFNTHKKVDSEVVCSGFCYSPSVAFVAAI